ncbi:hypothetical protein, partial [Kiloniella spongiae]|uniref:hypothetical protein n=1 Tax=Kiloniella spongiae TaxID=1489064 RepID=UPI00195086AC
GGFKPEVWKLIKKTGMNVESVKSAFRKYENGEFNIVNIYREIFSAISEQTFPPLPSQSKYLKWSAPWQATEVPQSVLNSGC